MELVELVSPDRVYPGQLTCADQPGSLTRFPGHLF
jgi:hypothetical protein